MGKGPIMERYGQVPYDMNEEEGFAYSTFPCKC